MPASSIRAQTPRADKEVQAAITSFFTALTRNDLPAARASAIFRAEDAPLLEALGAVYAAQSEFHDTYKTVTGFDPGAGQSIRTGITKFMPDGEVLFNADRTAAHCFWGDIPLRKIEGQWKFDLPEYDRTHTLAERLAVLRAEPAFWRDAAVRIQTEKKAKWWEAQVRVDELRRAFDKQHEKILAAAEQLRADRCFADLQGRWKVSISTARAKDDPRFNNSTATLTVKDKTVIIEASEKLLDGGTTLYFWSFTTRSSPRKGDPLKAEWSMRFQRPLGELRGVLEVSGAEADSFYNVVGTRLP